jgi:putative two-component system response regulator
MSDQSMSLCKVLVVDDEPTIRLTLSATVESFGYSCVSVSSGEEAMDALSKERFEIIISDWEMPGMGGLQLCRNVRAANRAGYIYFILLTSNCSPAHTVEGLEAGADDFLTKPFNPAELRVRMLIAQRIRELDTMDVTIMALAKLAESRDPETGEHLDRVQEYTRLLAMQMMKTGEWPEIDEEFVRLLHLTSPLHDIGKVAIPDCILLKPGNLSDNEFEVMKSHTTAGADTLRVAMERSPNQPFLKMAHDIARSHHERYDATGYPDGLAGEDIPLPARIMAVADVYDALTSKRVYKNAMPHMLACGIIRDGAGSHFDPKIVLAFEQVSDEFERIRTRIDAQSHDGQAAHNRAA